MYTGDGYVIERNTRFPDHEGGNEQMLKNLLEERRPLNGWQLRQIATATATFDAAVAAVSAAPYVSTEYAIMSGVQKGTVLAKDPDRVAHTQTLGVSTGDGQRSDFIIMTNFDFFFGDRREYFDPTAGGGIGKSAMIHNAATPQIEVHPETYEVRADGVLLTCEPAKELAMAQRYFLF